MAQARTSLAVVGAFLVAAAALSLTARAGEPQPFHLVRSGPAPAWAEVEAPAVEVHVGEAASEVEQAPAVVTAERHTSVAVGDVDDGGGVVIRNSGVATASTGGNTVSGGGWIVTGPATAVAGHATVSIGR